MRRLALELIERDDDELSDQEIFARSGADEFWYIQLCLETMHRLPSELDSVLLCREYTLLQAYHIIKKAMGSLVKTFGQ